MGTLVLNRKSASVKMEGEHLLIHDHVDGSLRRVPLVNVERVIVCGEPAVTFPVLVALMDRNVPCSFVTAGGRWRGLMDGDGGFHAERRMLQYERVSDERFCLAACRRTVADKLANSRRSLQRLFSNRGLSAAGDAHFRRLTAMSAELASAQSASGVRGVEGAAAAAYFASLAQFFPADCPFVARSRRPPKNAANALLSFVYALLMNEFVAAVRSHGLDVAAGFFHRGHDRSPALALDLMEPYRPVMADRLVLDLLNHRRIRPDGHFEFREHGGVRLNEAGRRIVFRAFDEEMRRTQTRDGVQISVRTGIDRTICRYIESLESSMPLAFFRAA